MSELRAKLEAKKPSTYLFSFFKYFSVILASLVCLVPVVVCVFTAFKTIDEYNATSVLTEVFH